MDFLTILFSDSCNITKEIISANIFCGEYQLSVLDNSGKIFSEFLKTIINGISHNNIHLLFDLLAVFCALWRLNK